MSPIPCMVIIVITNLISKSFLFPQATTSVNSFSFFGSHFHQRPKNKALEAKSRLNCWPRALHRVQRSWLKAENVVFSPRAISGILNSKHTMKLCTGCKSPNSITPTLRQSTGQVPNKVADTNHESPRHKSRRRLSWFVFHDFPRGEVSVKVGVMEFGLNIWLHRITTLLRREPIKKSVFFAHLCLKNNNSNNSLNHILVNYLHTRSKNVPHCDLSIT